MGTDGFFEREAGDAKSESIDLCGLGSGEIIKGLGAGGSNHRLTGLMGLMGLGFGASSFAEATARKVVEGRKAGAFGYVACEAKRRDVATPLWDGSC